MCTHILTYTHTPTHTVFHTHVAAIQAHSELFLLAERKEKCIQARGSYLSLPYSPSRFLQLYVRVRRGEVGRERGREEGCLLSCRCRTCLSLAALLWRSCSHLHAASAAPSSSQSFIHTLTTHLLTAGTHSATHSSLPSCPILACSFIHCNGARCSLLCWSLILGSVD